MSQLAVQRVFSGVFTILFLLLFVFCLGALVPIDPTLASVGDNASEAAYTKAKEALGLHYPLWKQLGLYFSQLFRLDLGISSVTSNPVLEDLIRVFPSTIELSFFSLLFGVFFGVPIGVMAGWKRDSFWNVVQKGQIAIYSAPNFLLAILFLLIFYVSLGWLPGPGRVDLSLESAMVSGSVLFDGVILGNRELFWSGLKHLVLPSVILGLMCMVTVSRFTRSFIVEQLGQPFIMTALMKGVSPTRVVWVHAFRAILLPLLTVVVMCGAHLLEGALIVEMVFARQGIGSYLVQSLLNMDRNAILGATLLIGVLFVGLNTSVDFITHKLDPRTKR